MFARLLAKKKKPGYVEDESEKRMKKIMDIVGKVDAQIDTFTKQAEVEQDKRLVLLEKAKEAKLANKTVLLRRLLHNIKLCDQKFARLSNMAIQLERQRDTCEAILAHSDFAKVCEDANMLVMEFGMDPDAAQNLIDKAQDWKDKLDELDGIMAEGAEDDEDIADIEAELDDLITADNIKEAREKDTLPVAPSVVKVPAKPVAAKKAPVAEVVAEDDLDSMLAGLDI